MLEHYVFTSKFGASRGWPSLPGGQRPECGPERGDQGPAVLPLQSCTAGAWAPETVLCLVPSLYPHGVSCLNGYRRQGDNVKSSRGEAHLLQLREFYLVSAPAIVLGGLGD